MLFDSHAHLNFEDFKDDWPAVIADCQKNDVWLVNVGSQLETSKKAVALAEKYDKGVWAAVGLHPIHAPGSGFHPEVFQEKEYADLIKASKKIVAVGETGLDFYHTTDNFAEEKKLFLSHVKLAKEFSLPLIIHCRNSQNGAKNAYQEILKIIKAEKLNHGVIHCFGGTLKEALNFLTLGFYLGFTGIITFDKTEKLNEIVKNIPLDGILIETDCPYLAPKPYRGQRNQPPYVRLVAEEIAKIKGIEYNEIARQSFANATNLFKIK